MCKVPICVSPRTRCWDSVGAVGSGVRNSRSLGVKAENQVYIRLWLVPGYSIERSCSDSPESSSSLLRFTVCKVQCTCAIFQTVAGTD